MSTELIAGRCWPFLFRNNSKRGDGKSSSSNTCECVTSFDHFTAIWLSPVPSEIWFTLGLRRAILQHGCASLVNYSGFSFLRIDALEHEEHSDRPEIYELWYRKRKICIAYYFVGKSSVSCAETKLPLTIHAWITRRSIFANIQYFTSSGSI